MKKRITLLILFVLTTYALSFAQDRTIKGVVKDKQGLTVPGVSVRLKGSKNGVSTGPKGEYVISAPANGTLIFSSVGFVNQEIAIDNRTQIDIAIAETTSDLSEVVVIGYGTALKKDVTGAVSSVKASQLENENPASITDILKGNIPGLNVGVNTSARGGETKDLLVRGKTSLTGNTFPLIVLDGVIYIGQLSDINPNDIETVDVLKDASSLAVYGAKAATGVIAITTKKGKTGKPVITFNTNIGLAQMAVNQKVYDGPGFLNWRADVARSGGTQPDYIYNDPNNLPAGVTLTQWLNGQTSTNPTDLWLSRLGLLTNEKNNYYAGKTEDWYKDLFRVGLRQDHTISLSGRKEDVTYYMSAGYTKNQNLIQGGEYSVARVRLNLEGKATKFLTLGMNLQYSDRDEGAIEADWSQLTNLSPYGDFYNADGSIRRIPTDDNGLNARNPFLATTYNSRLQKQNTLFGTAYAKVTLPFGITYQLNFSPGLDSYRTFNALSSLNPDVTTPGGSATRNTETRYNWQLDHLLKWNKKLDKHSIDVTLLANAEKYQTWYTATSNEGFVPSDVLGYHNIGSGIKPGVSSDDRAYTGDALMARVNYSFMDRYSLTASVRRDGYSGFGSNYKRATFPAAALAWTFSEESFMKSVKWLNYGKLRLSYGINGNREIRNSANTVIDPYPSKSSLDAGFYQTVDGSGAATSINTVFISSRLGNDNLKWERTSSLNAGIDFAILNNRISGSVDAYTKKTTDLLISQTVPNPSGYINVNSNIAQVNNKGFEFGITSKNITSGNVIWNSTVTFALNRNKIVKLASPNDDLGNKWFIGKDINEVWDYKILGVWQANEMTEAAKFNKGIKPGDFKLEDKDGNYVYNDSDKQFLGSQNPKFTWALRNEFNIYKQFDFSFQLVANMNQLIQDNLRKNQPGSVGFGRSSSYVVPYWTPDNPINDYARLNSGLSGASFDVWKKTSFIRLNNISLGYTLPKQIIEKLNTQSIKVYFSVNNAAIYAPGWNNWDPQNGGPTPRYYTLGLNVSL